MLELIALVAPIFGLVAIGLVARGSKLLDVSSSKGLTDFFYLFATPALLYKLIAFNTMPDVLPFGYIASYYIGMAISWGFVAFMTLKVLKTTWGESVIAGLSTGHANSVLIGIPLLINVYGEAAATPIAFLMAVNMPITMTLATLLLEGGKASSPLKIIKHLGKSVFTHPILLAIMAAYFSKFIGFTPPLFIKSIIEMLAAAAIPASLVALGMSLFDYGIASKLKVVGVITFAKLLFHPFLTFVVAHYFFQLPPLWVGSAVIFASMPAGVNAFLFAKRYGEGEEIASGAVAITTLISLFSIVMWLAVLPK